MAKFNSILIVAIALAGCAGSAKHQEQNAKYQEQRMQQRIENLKSRCASIGFADGTPDNAMCVLELVNIQAETQSEAADSGRLGVLCKRAIADGDSGGIRTHCH